MKISFSAEKFKELSEKELNIARVESDIRVNNLYIEKDKKPWYIVSGEFQYSRYPREFWEEEILKIKAGGVNVIATYCFWNHHEYELGKWNFSGDMDLKYFISLCKKHGMMVILRAGPYCHGEVIYGGFPKKVFFYPKKRSNDKKYLSWVRELFTRYYNEVKDYLYPNGNIIAMQLENEFTGRYDHILKLKELAVDVGFKLPVYTVTSWSGEMVEGEVVPLSGTYPEAPWEQNMRPLPDGIRFKILPHYIDAVVGNDSGLVDTKTPEIKRAFTRTPLGLCELGAGVQATSHRRPYISEKDAYAMSFIAIAKGINILGYYIYHGGRNPNFAPLQETRKTFYPNNLPLLSYDFQAPIGEYGYPKEKFYHIRLLHYFCTTFDENFAEKQPFFPSGIAIEKELFTTSVRIDEKGVGYHFINTYERLNKGNGCEDLAAEIAFNGGKITLPKITLGDKQCFFYPFNLAIGGALFEYITAQPFLKIKTKNTVRYLFLKNVDVDVCFAIKGGENGKFEVKNGEVWRHDDNGITHIIELYTFDIAKYIYYDGEQSIYSENFMYADGEKIVTIKQTKCDLSDKIKLTETTSTRKKFDKYFYGKHKTKTYKLEIDKSIFANADDIKIELDSACDMAHIYLGDKIEGDYININNDFTLYLARYKKGIEKGLPLVIRTNAKKKSKKTYFETVTPSGDAGISIKSVSIIKKS